MKNTKKHCHNFEWFLGLHFARLTRLIFCVHLNIDNTRSAPYCLNVRWKTSMEYQNIFIRIFHNQLYSFNLNQEVEMFHYSTYIPCIWIMCIADTNSAPSQCLHVKIAFILEMAPSDSNQPNWIGSGGQQEQRNSTEKRRKWKFSESINENRKALYYVSIFGPSKQHCRRY